MNKNCFGISVRNSIKEKLIKAWEASKEDEINLPYRICLPRTDCAFIFIPLSLPNADHWSTALHNYTLAHKYDQKAGRCIGVVVKPYPEKAEKYIDMNWMYVEQEWFYDDLIEVELENNFPFIPVSMKKIDNQYVAEDRL